jgi:hypothetical protein
LFWWLILGVRAVAALLLETTDRKMLAPMEEKLSDDMAIAEEDAGASDKGANMLLALTTFQNMPYVGKTGPWIVNFTFLATGLSIKFEIVFQD